MALGTLKGLKTIGGFKVVRSKGSELSWDEFDELVNPLLRL